MFRPSFGQKQSRRAFEDTLDVVEEQLGVTPGPFFLKQGLSIVDLQFVSHIERMLASVPYWAGFKIRGGEGSARWPNIDTWFDAFESMPSYMASKSDYYTHVQDIPPQYGPGYDEPGSGAKEFAAIINGEDKERGGDYRYLLSTQIKTWSRSRPLFRKESCGTARRRHTSLPGTTQQ